MICVTIAIVFTLISLALVPILGLKILQTLGFFFVFFLCVLLSSLFEYLDHYDDSALFGLYAIAYSSLNFGLGITTYSLPPAIYPQEIRTTFNGISAAMGKTGAALGAFTFIYIANSEGFGYSGLIGLCALIALIGSVVTFTQLRPSDFLDIQSSNIEKQMNDVLL